MAASVLCNAYGLAETKQNAGGTRPVGGYIGGQFEKWWLVPIGILTTSVLIATGIIVYPPTLLERSSENEVAHHGEHGEHGPAGTSGSTLECFDTSATDHTCYQQRYESLVRVSGIDATFAELKDEFTKDEFVNSNCHHLTHSIGRVAAELYGDISSAYSQGDNFCASGYYHGVIEGTMATLGTEAVLNEADSICADLRDQQNRSFDLRNCLHGLGHGSMYVLGNELFEALRTCDSLADDWEKDQCSGGVFMENLNIDDNPGHVSKYLKADQAFYPCHEVKTEYKTQCYVRHTEHALKMLSQPNSTQQDNFAKVFDLCAKEVEDGYKPACYSGVGHLATTEASLPDSTDEDQAAFARELCMLGQDYEALHYCVIAAARQFVYYYNSEVQAKELCDPLTSVDLRAVCLQRTEEQAAKQQYRQESAL